MYTSFFGLNEKPFSITPDPRYLFLSERHAEALAHLVYGVTESGGFIQLTGEVGTGKTTLCRTLLVDRMPENADVAVVLNPQLSATEFLEAICEEIGIPLPEPRGSSKALIDALNRHLLGAHADGRRTILIADEAQNLAPEVLEQVRLLTNLETARQKLLQIILIGQPELRELLARNDLRQLAQRITGRYHLEPLSREETARYIDHRLKVAGALGEVFDAGARREVFRLSQGVPRLINVICDRALLGAYSRGSRRVDRTIVRRAAAEVTGEPGLERGSRKAWPLAGAAAVVLVAAGALWWFAQADRSPGSGPVEAATADAAAPERAAPAAVPAAEENEAAATDVTGTAPDPALSLDEELVLAGDLTTRADAFARLAALWSPATDGAVPADCAAAAGIGLACLDQRGSWNSLRRLDRPAVLELVDSRGDTHHVLLEAVEGNQALLSIGGVDVMHPVSELTDLWFGDYLLLWRPAGGTAAMLAPGSRGPAVARLRESLADVDNRYATDSPDPEVYDEALAGRVREFQRDNRLDVDGVAGHQTQIVLASLLAPDGIPRLATARLARE